MPVSNGTVLYRIEISWYGIGNDTITSVLLYRTENTI